MAERQQFDVFISYSRKDYVDSLKNVIPGNEVSKIKDALTKAGISYWFDKDGVYSGDEFAKVIVRNIKSSRIFVFLSTENSNQSEWTANEISTAYMLKKKIIPVRIDDSVYHDDVILYLSRLSHIDYGDNPADGCQELVRSIKAYLEKEKAAVAQKEAEERLRQEELERQRRQAEEEKHRQKLVSKLEVEIAAEESRLTEFKKTVLIKEQELKAAKVDQEACEKKLLKLQQKLAELIHPHTVGVKRKSGEEAEEKGVKDVENMDLSLIEVNGKYGFADKTGKVVIPRQWKNAGSFHEGLARVQNAQGKWGFICKTGEVMIPCQWMNAGSLHDGLALVQNDQEMWGYIDKMGKVVIPCQWIDAGSFHEGLARVKNEQEKWGFIDKTGKVVIPCQWEWSWSFSEGLARVQDKRGKCGFVDKKGKVVIPCQWKFAGPFSKGLASVTDESGKLYKIDKTGKVVSEG